MLNSLWLGGLLSILYRFVNEFVSKVDIVKLFGTMRAEDKSHYDISQKSRVGAIWQL